jgi:hypothetical protein
MVANKSRFIQETHTFIFIIFNHQINYRKFTHEIPNFITFNFEIMMFSIHIN